MFGSDLKIPLRLRNYFLLCLFRPLGSQILSYEHNCSVIVDCRVLDGYSSSFTCSELTQCGQGPQLGDNWTRCILE